jgi:hypothetical protein
VERRKVTKGAGEDSLAAYQLESGERGRASLTGYSWKSRYLRLKRIEFMARFRQSRNYEGTVDGKSPRRGRRFIVGVLDAAGLLVYESLNCCNKTTSLGAVGSYLERCGAGWKS